jgi:hypothetical protein
MAIRLKIPERDHKPLGRVAALPDGDLDALLRALAECQPSLRRRDLVRQLAGKTILSEGELTALLRLFLTLFNLREDYHVATEVLVEEICRAATAVEELGLKSDQEKRERLKARLTRVLSLERSLGATAKALSVAFEHKYLLHQARIVTDLRPIFGANASEPPAAFVVSHVLCLECHKDKGEEELFVALDSADLSRLADVVKRAQQKDEALSRSIAPCGIKVLSFDED